MIEVIEERLFPSGIALFGRAAGGVSDLAPEERALLSPRATAKRQADFVAGRLMAQEALRRAFGGDTWRVLRNAAGAPVACGDNAACVSISHVDGWVAAAAALAPIALDTVKVEPLPEALCEEAFSARERAAWSASGMAAAFAAKEATLKWLGTGMGTPLRAIEVLPAEDDLWVCGAGIDQRFLVTRLVHRDWLTFIIRERGTI